MSDPTAGWLDRKGAVMGDKRGAWRIGGYVADELIGYGASAQVWRGHVGRTSEPVALKVLDLADASAVRAARTEAALLSALDHPHLVRFRELVPDGESIVLVLELAVGGSLADLLARRGRLSPGEVVGVISPIAAALAYSHDQGVVHSDVAPANILFRADGSPVLADLGVARLIGGFDAPRSTLAYVDPGVAAGGIPSDASDVFMAAATALHAVTGAPPWSGTTAEAVLANAATGQIDRLDERLAAVPPTVAAVIRRGLSAAPAARGSAAEFALDLRHAAAPVPIDLHAGHPRERRPREQSGQASVGRAGVDTESDVSVPSRAGHQPRHAAPVSSAVTASRAPSGGALRAPGPSELRLSVTLDRPDFVRPEMGRRNPVADVSDPDPVVPQTQPRLALTHVVRARVRPPEPAPGLGFWGKWKVDGRRWAPLALATVALVVLGVAGVAWLRWAPAWPRRAAAAPLANGATATAPSGSATGSPPTSTRPAPTRRSIGQRTGPPTGGEPTATIAPTATPSGGKPTTAPSSAPRSIGSSQWAAVLSALDRHRQTAFATDDPAPLAAVYVPGTLLRQDLAALHQVVGPGCRLIGLRTRYQGVRVSSTARRQVVLATSASLDASSLQCPGTPTRRLPPHRPVAMTVVLVPNRSSYLISGIEVSV